VVPANQRLQQRNQQAKETASTTKLNEQSSPRGSLISNRHFSHPGAAR